MRQYLSNDELANDIEDAIRQGQPTAKVCRDFITIAEHILQGARYRNYKPEDKADMVSAVLLKCLKSVPKNYNPDRRGSIFNYVSRIALTAIWTWLSSHYKYINLKRKLAEEWKRIATNTPLVSEGEMGKGRPHATN